MDDEDGDCRVYKILLAGDSNVGKSCLLTRFVDDTFDERNMSTIGLDMKVKWIAMDEHGQVKLELRDTAGSERFQSVTNSYFRGQDGIIIVYDVTSKKSFDNVDTWLKHIHDLTADDMCTIIVGNKTDQSEHRQVELSVAKTYAKEKGIPLIETSAKDSDNVEKVFSRLVKRIKETRHADNTDEGIRLLDGMRRRINCCRH